MGRQLVPYLMALIFAGVGGLLVWNTHAEIFSCRRADYAYGAGSTNYGEPKRNDATCSLLYVTDPTYARYNAKIEPGGWALAVFLGLVVPATLGGVMGRFIVSPKKRVRAAETGDDEG